MPSFKNIWNKYMVRTDPLWPIVFVCILAVVLQIQITLMASEAYRGLRINLGDLFLPLMGGYVLFLIARKRINWPKWGIKYGYGWLFLLSLVMTISLVNGYYTNGFLSGWALTNKYIGFFVLLGYFFLGGCIIENSKDMQKTLSAFLVFFCGFFSALLAVTTVLLFIQFYSGIYLFLPYNPWAGLMANRNAYAVVAAFAMVMVIYLSKPAHRHLPDWICLVFWFLLPLFLYHNASRAIWILVIPLLAALILKRPASNCKSAIFMILSGVVFMLFTIFALGITSEQGKDQFRHFRELVEAKGVDTFTEYEGAYDGMYEGDQKRMIAVEDGLDLYKKSGNPLLGAGLGTYQPFQMQKRGRYLDVMDFTGLWLLVETGALGLAVFTAFFATLLFMLFQRYRTADISQGGADIHRDFTIGVLVFLLCVAFMSLLHELLYTRFVWFVMGMAAARVPRQFRTSET